MAKLASLRLQAFRGVRDEHIDLSGKSLFIYGENGTGKSSIIDALEYFFTGTVSHLEGVQSLSTRRHAPHVKLGPDSLAVDVRFQGFEHPSTRTLKADPSPPKNLTSYFDTASRSHFILRRQQLLAFLLEQAAPRYQQLAALIGIDELDRIELAWKAAVDAADTQSLEHERRQVEAAATLDELLGPVPDYGDSTVLAALNTRLAKYDQAALPDLAAAQQRKLDILTGAGHRDRAERSAQLARLQKLTEQLTHNIAALGQHDVLWTGIDDLRAETERLREIRFREVLGQASDLITRYSLDKCPVCSQEIDRQAVLEELTKRIMESEALAESLARVNRQKAALQRDLGALRSEADALRKALAVDDSLLAQESALISLDTWCEEYLTRLGEDIHRIALGPLADFLEATVLTELQNACAGLRDAAALRIQALAETDSDRRIVALIDLLTRSSDAFVRHQRAAAQLDLSSREAHGLRQINQLLGQTKKDRIQQIYSELESDIDRYYNIIHPSEIHGDVKLEIVTSRRGSAEIKMGFADEGEVDPRAYNSEAHLDSLGLCIFLAFVKRFNGGLPLLALDDVVSSVDASHRARVCKLIFTEFPNHQLFITTHDQLWYEQLIAYQQALKFGPVRRLRITGWSLDDGPRFIEFVPRWELLDERLRNADKQGAASLARKTLEWLLFELAVNFEASVTVRRDARYDVGSLLDPVVLRARKVIPNFEDTHKDVLTDFRGNLLLGNLLTHHNSFAEGASIEDVRAFAIGVRALHDIFWCDECGAFPRYFRDAKLAKCDCGKREWRGN